jgi:hypothetical protein
VGVTELLDSVGSIVAIMVTFLIVLGVIWRLQSGHDDGIEKELAGPQSRSHQNSPEDDLRHRIDAIEVKLELHRKHIVQTERRLKGAGIIIWALIFAGASLYALGRNDWVPGLCFLAMALSFGIYGLVNVFSSKRSREITVNNHRSPT